MKGKAYRIVFVDVCKTPGLGACTDSHATKLFSWRVQRPPTARRKRRVRRVEESIELSYRSCNRSKVNGAPRKITAGVILATVNSFTLSKTSKEKESLSNVKEKFSKVRVLKFNGDFP
jgi:hypothetical protein